MINQGLKLKLGSLQALEEQPLRNQRSNLSSDKTPVSIIKMKSPNPAQGQNPFYSVKLPHKRNNAFGFTEEEVQRIKPGSD